VRRYGNRSRLIPSDDIHEAAEQCSNYIRTLDELGSSLQTYYKNELNLDYDYRRSKATVVIGHPDHVDLADVTKEQIAQVVRSYNSDRSRVQVLTYADLLDCAERALSFKENPES
jgi:hypothetical protein